MSEQEDILTIIAGSIFSFGLGTLFLTFLGIESVFVLLGIFIISFIIILIIGKKSEK